MPTPARTPRSCSRPRCRRSCDDVPSKPAHFRRAAGLRRRTRRGVRSPRPAGRDRDAGRPHDHTGFQSGDCNNVTDADITKAVGSATFTKVVDSDAGCFWQENTMLGSFGAGMGISTWWYRGSDMDTERTLETAGRPHADRTVRRRQQGVQGLRRQRLQHLRGQGRRRHHLVDPDDEPGHAARSVRHHRATRTAQPGPCQLTGLEN